MKKTKILLISIITIIVLIITIVFLIVVLNTTEGGNTFLPYVFSGNGHIVKDDESNNGYTTEKFDQGRESEIRLINNDFKYIKAVNAIKQYYKFIDDNNNSKLLKILAPKYIEKNNVNVSNNLTRNKGSTLERTYDEIYFKEMEKYLTYFIIKVSKYDIEASNARKSQEFLLLVIDFSNSTFTIEPIGEKEYTNYIDGSLELNDEYTIEPNSDNQIVGATEGTDKIIQILSSMLKIKLLYDKESAFDFIDKEYKERKFKDIDEFKNFIDNRTENIVGFYPIDVSVTYNEEYMECVCGNENNNYWVFKIKNVSDYTVLLDSHTVNTTNFEKKYIESDDANKAALNIEKIKEAINSKDYKYLYKYSYKGFRDKYYPTEQDIENFFKTNLYALNSFEYTNIETQEDNFIFDVTVTDARSNADSSKAMQGLEKVGKKMVFVVKLYADPEYAVSFSMSKEE